MSQKSNRSVLIGAAFLMATSAIGPGFLTQTAVFTASLGASFGFVILISILLDVFAQLNVWRIITVAGKPAQDIANSLFPGLGYLLSLLVFLGGMAFNIGNIAGAGLGLNVLFGISTVRGAVISTLIAIAIFVYRQMGKAMDAFAKLLGLLMIALTCYIAWASHPPVAEAIVRSVAPVHFSFAAVLTIVGGTVGGYITFAGAHRLLDAGTVGRANLGEVNKGAVTAIGLASVMRIVLFLAALGVVTAGGHLDAANPSAAIFRLAGGAVGYKLFGLVMWAAAITSVVGSAFTSVSFIKTFHPLIQNYNRQIIILFIIISAVLFVFIGQPVKVLIAVGAINGLILPVSLGVMLFAAYRINIVGQYKQPIWLTVAGAIVVGFMIWMGFEAIAALII
jgi:Mn2+/Fe2+ NRAMP family transporter